MNYKLYHTNYKLLINFKKHFINKITLLMIAFFALTTTTFAQGTTCGSAETLVINGPCDSASITDTTENGPTSYGCSFNTFRH